MIFCLTSSLFSQGFYKDVFWDRGVGLDTTYIPVFQSLGLSFESIQTEDAYLQNSLIIGNEHDTNGILLYPDNSPRFKAFYTPGGDSRLHGNSLTDKGRARIRTFYDNGGSYVGICGGAAIVSLSRNIGEIWEDYYQIWPGYVHQVRMGPLYLDNIIPKDSPLLLYRSFGEDHIIDSLRFTYGSYPVEDKEVLPKGTKILLRYQSPSQLLDNKASCWSYRKGDTTGTAIVINCHPENDESGEHLLLTESLFLYAMNGTGVPRIKGTLEKGEMRYMNKDTKENDPNYTKIGDNQYHHFFIEIQKDVQNFTIQVKGEEDFEFNVYMNKDKFAFNGASEFKTTSNKSNIEMTIPHISSGKWYISVECTSTIGTAFHKDHVEYIDNLKLLNGIAYSIKVDWK